MDTLTLPRARAAHRLLGALRGAGLRLVYACAAAYQRACDRAVLARLDEHTLRDVGLCRSEFGSCDAEARGDAAPTRLRLHQRPRRLPSSRYD